jgi:hypothetical protein
MVVAIRKLEAMRTLFNAVEPALTPLPYQRDHQREFEGVGFQPEGVVVAGTKVIMIRSP